MLVFIIVLVHNPAYFYRQFALGVFSLWSTVVALEGLSIEIDHRPLIFVGLNGSSSWMFHGVVCLVILALIAADYLYMIRVHQTAKEAAIPSSTNDPKQRSEVETEQERLLKLVGKDERSKLILAELQASSGNVNVDTGNLTKAQQHDIAIHQVNARQQLLLKKERRWYVALVALIVITWLVASSLVME